MLIFKKQKSIKQLPKIIKLLTLPEIMLLPQTQLPLNVFEKKYISMIDKAIASDRLIGMIQPIKETNDSELHKVGCIGRIISFQESTKEQYHITLLGLCRFTLIKEIKSNNKENNNLLFKTGNVHYNNYSEDFIKPNKERQKLINRSSLISSIKNMLIQMNLDIDWNDLANTPNEMLVNAISMTSPFQIAEKQALLEAMTVADRAKLLVVLSKMATSNITGNFDLIQ